MIITYQGVESFKISHGDLTLALNPVSKDSKHKSVNFGADITLISLNHPDTNGAGQTTRGDKEPFVITGPGEYEAQDVVIRGMPSKSLYDGVERINTLYYIHFEGMDLCYLGALSDPALGSDVLESIENVDILFVPVGEGLLKPAEAYKLAVSLEAKLVIPMHYNEAELKQFLKEGGEEKIEPQDKLVLKKKDLEDKSGEIILLKEE